jgi:hypothetical protein
MYVVITRSNVWIVESGNCEIKGLLKWVRALLFASVSFRESFYQYVYILTSLLVWSKFLV